MEIFWADLCGDFKTIAPLEGNENSPLLFVKTISPELVTETMALASGLFVPLSCTLPEGWADSGRIMADKIKNMR